MKENMKHKSADGHKEREESMSFYKIFTDTKVQMGTNMKKKSFVAVLLTFMMVITTIFVFTACGGGVQVALNKNTLSLEVGRSETLKVTFTPETAENQNVTWTSSNPQTASVDENGKVTALSVGLATITVKAEDGGKSAACEVTVTPVSAREISLNKEIMGMQISNEETLTVVFTPANTTNKAVTWSVQPSGIVNVNQDGKVTALALGTATVTASSADGSKTAACEVRVIPKTVSSPQDFANINLKLDGEFYLTKDIDFKGEKTAPIGTWNDIGKGATDQKFTGTFDGKGYALINLEMDGNAVKLNNGKIWGNALFCQIGAGGVVKNLNVIDLKAHGDGGSGGIAGSNSGTIENCYVEANVYSHDAWDSWPWAAGGAVAGYNQASGVIRNVIANCNTEKTYVFTGNNYGSVTNCFAVIDEVSLTNPLTEFASIMKGNVPEELSGYQPGDFTNCTAFSIFNIAAVNFSAFESNSVWITDNGSGKGPYLTTAEKTEREWLEYYAPITGTIQITSLQGLLDIKKNIATLAAKYVLLNDIDATSINWSSLGNFTGKFDGRGHKITIASSTGIGNLGLFLKVMPGATVENLELRGDAKFASWAGGICQDNFGTIRNCLINLTMTANGQDGYLGGVACNNKASGVIERCVVLSEIKGMGTVAQTSWNGKSAPNGGIVTGQESGAVYNECYFNYETANGSGNVDSVKGQPLVMYTLGNDVYSGTDSFPALKKNTAELKETALYAGWDVNIWNIVNGQYPSLKTA